MQTPPCRRPAAARFPVRPLALVSALTLAAALPASISAEADGPFAPLPDAAEVDEERAELGRMLFFDDRLSGDRANSCATCHSPDEGWSDGQALSDGYTGVDYFRNAPSLFNVAHREYLMWDARLDGADLPTAVRDMITEAHTMNADSRIVQERLKQVPEYVERFDEAYGGDPYGGQIYGAVAEFLKTIRTEDAPFDRYLRGEEDALSEQQLRGKALFAGKANCVACHSGEMLTDHEVHALGVPDHIEIRSDVSRQTTMLRHYATMGVPGYMNLRADVGNHVVGKEEADKGRFLTPSLWDVGQTAPYMHSGVFETLEEVVAFYNRGGGEHPNKTDKLSLLGLTAGEKADLVAFLESLTGEPPDVERPDLPAYEPRDLGMN